MRVRGAHLHANEASVDSKQQCGDVAVLLLERPLAQQQGLRTQSIDDVDGLQSLGETPLEALCGVSTSKPEFSRGKSKTFQPFNRAFSALYNALQLHSECAELKRD